MTEFIRDSSSLTKFLSASRDSLDKGLLSLWPKITSISCRQMFSLFESKNFRAFLMENKIIKTLKRFYGYFLCIGSTGYNFSMSKNVMMILEENIHIRKRKTGLRNDKALVSFAK